MPPKKQTGGLIDPLMNFSLIKASDVRILSGDTPGSYTTKNYMAEYKIADPLGVGGGGAYATKSSRKPTKSQQKQKKSK